MSSGERLGHDAEDAARQAAQSMPVQILGRVGLMAYGFVHILLAYLAVRLAVGGGGASEASKAGALQTLAGEPGGRALLWVIAVGLGFLVVWQLAEAVWPHGGAASSSGRLKRRVSSAAQAVVFGALAVSAGQVAGGGGADSASQQQSVTAQVLQLPLGQVLVGAVGVGVVAVAGFLVHRGVTRKFAEELELSGASPAGRFAAMRLGQVGFPALGVAYGIVGVLVVAAAWSYDPDKAAGLDAALKTLADQPFGRILLGVVAAGLACFGVYCLFDAWYRRA